ncbi:molybdopterin molybdotransferase MoeA [Neokomagataea thailandica]|uniref:Molybdopterin molybdenumtransferase n=1 Tax=Neokomagataea tanensis NBRC 106556 TaxID=1223519 RepID=A0ABQ0QG08_9PROT|nr:MULTISPECIES: molybdopterin molybdotransferase MoeA [Neokomagataea]GBR43283.1 molybdopterin biosynthesis protein MoeA [Neokomagataea tanensis NBRC 106556]
MNALITVARAEALIWESAGDFGTIRVPLNKAVGRTLRQVVRAERDQPPCDRAAVNGFAIRWADVPESGILQVVGWQRAGKAPLTLPDGSVCLEIMTGAILPEGADTVIPGERVERRGDSVFIAPENVPEEGAFVDRQGDVCQAQASLLEPGMVLRWPVLAVLAANGVSEVVVAADPSIGVFAVGDSLVPVDREEDDEPLEPWQLRRSSEYAITGALHGFGFKRGQRRHVPNDFQDVREALAEELATHDVLILGEGGPFGTPSAVASALEELDVRVVFDGVAQEPGSAFWFGVGPEGQCVFGLPADPVGVTVCMRRYVLPFLKRSQKRCIDTPPRVALAEHVPELNGLTRFVAVGVQYDDTGRAMAYPKDIVVSGEFGSLCDVDGFVEIDGIIDGVEPRASAVPFFPV